MSVALSSEVQSFLHERVLAHLATVMKDGSPQVTPLWVDTDGTYIIVNTAEGRTKERNMKRDARVALSITDPVNFLRYVVIRGRVAKLTTEGANENINQLSMKYSGRPYTMTPAQTRVKIYIEPTSVIARGL